MAWSRTALACCVVSAFMLRWLSFYGPALLVIPAFTLLAAVAISITQQRRIRHAVAGIKRENLPINPVPMLSLLGVCWALGIASLILVWIA